MTSMHFVQDMPAPASNVSESLRRTREIDELIHTLKYGEMPDFTTNPNSWYFEVEQRIKAILKKRKVHPSEAYRMARGIVHQAQADKCFDFYAIVDKALLENEQRERNKGDSVLEVIPPLEGHDMPKQQPMKEHIKPAGSVTLPTKPAPREITSSAQLVEMQKANGVPSTGEQTTEEIKAKAGAIRTADTHPTPESAEGLNDFFAQQTAHMDASVSPDIEPPKDDWSEFWISAKNLLRRIEIAEDDVHDWVHDFYHVKSTKEITNKSKGDILTEIRKEVEAQEKLWNDVNVEASKIVTEKRSQPPVAKPAETSAPVTPAQAPEPPRAETGTTIAPPTLEALPIASQMPSSNGVEKAVSVPSVFAPTQVAVLPDMARWDVMRQQAGVLIKSGFLPQSINTPEKALTIMMMGDALGVQPIVALNNINVIQGKPTVSPQLQLALIRRSGQLENFQVTDDGETCKVIIKRRGEVEHVETFSQSDAKKMNLADKDNWRKQPATMRRWRAISAACRLVFSDIVWGIASYTTEEIDPDFTIEAA